MNLENELAELLYPQQGELQGNLGLSASTVKVTTRPGFVWVRLLGSSREFIKAHNSKVANIYDLPVIIKFDGIKYEVDRVDVDRYRNWRTDSSFLVDHAQQHSALRGAEGNDIVWVDGQQFLPLLVSPVGVTGTMGVTIGPYNYINTLNQAMSVGATGLYGFNPIDPVNSNMYLIMLNDQTGNFYALTGTAFSPNLTGTSDVLNYVPASSVEVDRPLAAVKVTPGVGMNWNAIYDMRQMYSKPGAMLSSITGDLVTSPGSGMVTGTIPNKTISNSKLADMTGPVVMGRVTGTGVPEYLSPTDLLTIGLGAFGGAQENVNETPDGARTHFTFTNPALDIWVTLNGIIHKSDVTFAAGTTAFDLASPPALTDVVKVIRLAPVSNPISPGLRLREQHTATGTATLDFTTWYSTDYDEYLIEIVDIQPVTNAVDFYIRCSTDGGATFDTGNNYTNNHYLQATTGNVSVVTTTGKFLTRNNGEITNNSARATRGSLRFFTPGSASLYKRLAGNIMWSGGSNIVNTIFDGNYNVTTPVNALRFLFSSGNIASGTIRIYGVSKS